LPSGIAGVENEEVRRRRGDNEWRFINDEEEGRPVGGVDDFVDDPAAYFLELWRYSV